MEDNKVEGLEGLREALTWPHVPGLLKDERTQPQQLPEESMVREKLNTRSQRQIACAKADVDVKLRRALLRQFRGQEEDLNSGERCLYWREANSRFHTIRWKGPATAVAVQRDPDNGQVACYWLAHGTVLIRAGKQHVKRLLDQEGRMASRSEALEGSRQRRVVRVLDLPQMNRRSLEELDPEDEEEDLTEGKPAGPTHQLQHVQQVPSSEAQEQELQDQHANDESNTQLQGSPPQQPELPSQPSAGNSHEIVDTSLPPIPHHEYESAEENEEWLDKFMEADHTKTFEDAPNDPSFAAPTSGETFEQKRKRQTLQETIWLRSRQSRSEDTQEEDQQREKMRTDDHKESGQQNLVLPDGWTYDKDSNEFVLGNTEDFWTVEEGFLVRNHLVSREETFQWGRNMVDTCPVKSNLTRSP